jgi:TolB-like protein/tRNA A-37 threonylcarbamoyl transferase component Bud32
LAVTDVTASALAGALRDRYVLERELGRGGMATVYLAHDIKHDRKVALKVLHPKLGIAVGPERFQREIRPAARLQHPHILPLHDSGKTAGQLWYTMPFVHGESLRDRLRRERQLPISNALQITREAADALGYAHSQGIVHRDIKPENILLGHGHALVADFGIARALTSAGTEGLTEAGVSVGTPAYMSPEQVNGDESLDGRSDIYSLGCVLFEMVIGEPPFKGRTPAAVIANRLCEPVPSARARGEPVPDAFDAVIRRALSSKPSDRFPTAAAFVEALESITLASTGARGVRPGIPHVERHAIAVLPFGNLSADQESDYFSEGMTEELIHALARIPGLRVASRTSAFSVAKRDLDIRRIGEMLGVDAVLEGSVRRVGGRLRISTQLVDARSGYHLWSEMYDRESQDVFAVQNEIARATAAKLEVSLGSSDPSLVQPATRSLGAYHSYLRGRYFYNRPSQESLLKATEHFERAIEIDPKYAAAYSGLADSYHVLAVYGVVPPKEAYPRVKRAAQRAPWSSRTARKAMSPSPVP